jgi:hypothetical protein
MATLEPPADELGAAALEADVLGDELADEVDAAAA